MNGSPDHLWKVSTAQADLQLLLHEAPKSLPDFRDAVVNPLSPP